MGRKCRRLLVRPLSTFHAYFIVSSAAFGCYLNALHGDFIHDDIPAIVRNSDVSGTAPISSLLRNDFWGYPMHDVNSHKSYRPITTLTFRLNYAFNELRPCCYHAVNILLHVLCCVLFTRVSHVVANLDLQFATLAGIMFATHPVHTEAVTSVVGRADVLSSVFFLLSFLSYHDKSWRQTGLSCCLAGLSMLAKETGLTVLVVNLVYDVYKSWHSIKRVYTEVRWNDGALKFARRAAKIFMAMSVLLVFRLAMLQGTMPKFLPQDNPAAFHPCYHVRLLTFSYLAAFNVWLLLCPSNLSHDWQMGSIPLVASLADYRNIATCLLLAVCLWLAYRLLIDFEQNRQGPLLLGCLLSVLPFLPASNLAVTVGFVVAERILYMPSMGFVLLIIYGAQLLSECYPQSRQAMTVFLFILLITFSGKTIVRNQDWSSRETLTRAGLKALPHNAKMHYNWANFQRDSGNFSIAIFHYTEALRLWPSYASAHNNLGTLMNSATKAETHFLSAIRSSPGHVNAHYNLGQIYRKLNRTTDAVSMLEKCLQLNSGYTPAYLLLAQIYSGTIVGRLLRHVSRLQPTNPDYLGHYGNWLQNNYRTDEALMYYEKALQIKNRHQASFAGLSRCLRRKGQTSRLHQILHRWRRLYKPNTTHYSKLASYEEALSIHKWELYKQGQMTSVTSISQTVSDYKELRFPSLLAGPKSDIEKMEPRTILQNADSLQKRGGSDFKPG